MAAKKYRRTFWREDLENPDEPLVRVSLCDLANELNGDGSGPVRWTKNNVDLLRVAQEWEDIGFRLHIKEGDLWYTFPVPFRG